MDSVIVVLKGEKIYTSKKHFLIGVKVLGSLPETEHEGRAINHLHDGVYIEGCDCHPDSTITRLVEVENGQFYCSEDVSFDVLNESYAQ